MPEQNIKHIFIIDIDRITIICRFTFNHEYATNSESPSAGKSLHRPAFGDRKIYKQAGGLIQG